MKRVFLAVFLFALQLTALVYAQPEVDTTFGKRIVNSGHNGWAKDMVVQSDDKVVMVSSCVHFEDLYYSICMARLNTDGSMDTTFVGSENRVPGIVRNKFIPGCNCSGDIFGIAQQSDGRLVVVGVAVPTSGVGALVVARYNLDGSIDSSFGSGGSVVTDIGPNVDRGRRVSIQPDGKIVVVGYSFDGSEPYTTSQQFVARFTSSGVLDPSFGTGGVFKATLTNATHGESLAIQSDGKILAGGTLTGTEHGYLITRLNSNGTADTTWDGDGYKIILHGFAGIFQDSGILSVIPRPDGRVLALGSRNRIYRLNADGSLDTTFGFGLGWRYALNESLSQQSPYDMIVTGGGRITVVGQSFRGGLNYWYEIARYMQDGAEDLGFSDDGYLAIDIGTSNDGARGVSTDSQGRIVITGINAVQTCGLCNPWVPSSYSATRLIAPSVLVGLSGRVTRPDGRPVMKAILTTQDPTGATRTAITNPFGYYRFLNLPIGHAYTISARAKGRVFSDRIIAVNDEVVNFDFLAEEQ